MRPDLRVRFLPTLVREEDVVGACVIMTDVLRASSTIVSALANGATEVIPQAEIDDSIRRAKQLGPQALIGGERSGKKVDGFHLGNSPLEYTEARVSGRPVVLCTTNGTWALEFCCRADRILIGALVNLSDICHFCRGFERVTIVCAGTNREITGEDCLFAGAVVDRLAGDRHPVRDDQANIARQQWYAARHRVASQHPDFSPVLRECLGGRNLVRLGYDEDIRFCGTLDLVGGVPLLDQQQWSIQLAQPELRTVG